MIGKNIICFFKRNIYYFWGIINNYIPTPPQKRMCVYVQRLGGGMGHRNNKGASGWPRRAATPYAQEWRGGVGMGHVWSRVSGYNWQSPPFLAS